MQCHRSRIDKKLMKHTANALCTFLRKHKPVTTVAASIHFPFASFYQRQFFFVQNRVSWLITCCKVIRALGQDRVRAV